MTHSTISLGVGLGGGRSATSSGRLPAGGGTFNNALSLDVDGSDEYLNVPQGAFNLGEGNFTFSLWFNGDALNSTSQTLFLVQGENNASGGQPARFGGFVQSGRVIISDWGFSGHSYYATINNGEWYHFVTRRKGTGANDYSLWVNGVQRLTGTFPYSSDKGDDTASTRIGMAQTFGYNFNGKIDEFGFWNSALTDTNITDIYNSGVPNDLGANGLNLSPVGYWRMGDGTGDTNSGGGTPANGDTIGTVVDQGSGGNNATGTNGPLYSNSVPS
jgi:hypothetical protein